VPFPAAITVSPPPSSRNETTLNGFQETVPERPRVYIAQALDEHAVDLIRTASEVTLGYGRQAVSLDDVIGEMDALVVRSLRVPGDLLGRAKRLRVIVRAGTGMEKIDLVAAAERQIAVVNTGTANVLSVAEHTVALGLAAARSLVHWDGRARATGTLNRTENPSSELFGKTWGIVGFGNIGQRVAKMVHGGLDMKVLAYIPADHPEPRIEFEGVEVVHDLGECLAESDVVSLHVPLTPVTHRMIGAEQLALMKPTSVLINVSRGKVIDSEALIEALHAGHPGTAALDVFEPEFPMPPYALYDLPNVTITPHRASRTVESEQRTAARAVEQLFAALGLTAPTEVRSTYV
jgi:phosphoglycerate dehydrogenase-like enzyme